MCCVSSMAAEEPAARQLFNGKDLSGWTGEGYTVENGAIVCTPEGKALVTEEWFANYTLDFDFMLPAGKNAGVSLHYDGTGDPAYQGMRLQLLDNDSPQNLSLSPSQRNSSIFLLAPAKPARLKPAGEWNHQRVTVTASGLMIMLNDEVVLRSNLDEIRMRNPHHSGVNRRAGHIALLGNGGRVAFQNIRILEAAPLAHAVGATAAGYRSLFNGKNLAGWKLGESTSWNASNGILKYSGGPADLWSVEEYGDCTLVFDWRWTRQGRLEGAPRIQADGTEKRSPSGSIELEQIQLQNSGIYLRGHVPAEVNLWNWSCGSGEIHGYRSTPEIRYATTPKLKADRPLGEWNRTMISLKGDVISVSLNGCPVIENAKLTGLPARGAIGLQGCGSAVDFANFWIKPE
jgi:hypothetical protein